MLPGDCLPELEFLPDLDTFHRDWPNRLLPGKAELAGKAVARIRERSR